MATILKDIAVLTDNDQIDAAYRRGDLYRCHAFVCSVTCVKRTDRDPPPTATFQQIYRQRPADCRYVVVGVWAPDPSKNCERFAVFDLFEVKKDQFNVLIEPKPRFMVDDLDAAIMATVLLYNKGGDHASA